MKKILLPIALLFLLASCKKDKEVINPDEVRILKVKSVGTNNEISYVSFEYDQQGRINKVLSYIDNQTPTLISAISYSSNEIVIKETDVNNSGIIITSEARYTVDGSNRPIKKIYTEIFEVLGPASIPQKTFKADTTLYEYDAAGLLVKTTRGQRDSTYTQSNPINWQISIYLIKSVTNYTNTGSNIAKSSMIETFSSKTYNSLFSATSKELREANLAYEYDKNYANKTDFKNAIILTELGFLYGGIDCPLNNAYKNAPNKITALWVLKDENGSITSTNSFIGNYSINFNRYGFISTLNNSPAGHYNIELIYNK